MKIVFATGNKGKLREASEILGLHRSQARALLGEPDKVWESAAGRIQYIFKRDRVFAVKQKREARKEKMQIEHGLRACYFCREKYNIRKCRRFLEH